MTAEPFLPTRLPSRSLETAEFWDACAQGRFVLPRCDDCGEHLWYPRLVCPLCGSHAVRYVDASGRGTVYSFTIMRKGQGPFRDAAPYVLAMVTLDEGPTLLTNLVDVAVHDVAIGQRVHVVFEPVRSTDGRIEAALPRFTPDA